MSRSSPYKDVQILVVADTKAENIAYAISRAFGIEHPRNLYRNSTITERNTVLVSEGHRNFTVNVTEIDVHQVIPLSKGVTILLYTPRAIELSPGYFPVGIELFSAVSAKTVSELEENPEIFREGIKKILVRCVIEDKKEGILSRILRKWS